MRLFITGANRGLGYELAAAACAQGHSVIAGARQPEQAEKLLHLKEQYVGLLSIVPLDVASEESVRLASEESGRLLGPNKLDGWDHQQRCCANGERRAN